MFIIIFTVAIMGLPLCQARAVLNHKDINSEDNHDHGNIDNIHELNSNGKEPPAEDHNTRISNSAHLKSLHATYHPYGLDTLGQGYIF